jgi:hypothetical protein
MKKQRPSVQWRSVPAWLRQPGRLGGSERSPTLEVDPTAFEVAGSEQKLSTIPSCRNVVWPQTHGKIVMRSCPLDVAGLFENGSQTVERPCALGIRIQHSLEMLSRPFAVAAVKAREREIFARVDEVRPQASRMFQQGNCLVDATLHRHFPSEIADPVCVR